MGKLIASSVLIIFVVAAACSQDNDSAGTIAGDEKTIQMRDSFYEPRELTVRRGQEVMFRFVNDGKLRHDAFIGDAKAQDMHEDEMRMAEDDGHGGHAAGGEDAITVEPGESGRLSYRFSEPGEILIGCHEPGHYAAGMRVTVNVQ